MSIYRIQVVKHKSTHRFCSIDFLVGPTRMDVWSIWCLGWLAIIRLLGAPACLPLNFQLQQFLLKYHYRLLYVETGESWAPETAKPSDMWNVVSQNAVLQYPLTRKKKKKQRRPQCGNDGVTGGIKVQFLQLERCLMELEIRASQTQLSLFSRSDCFSKFLFRHLVLDSNKNNNNNSNNKGRNVKLELTLGLLNNGIIFEGILGWTLFSGYLEVVPPRCTDLFFLGTCCIDELICLINQWCFL